MGCLHGLSNTWFGSLAHNLASLRIFKGKKNLKLKIFSKEYKGNYQCTKESFDNTFIMCDGSENILRLRRLICLKYFCFIQYLQFQRQNERENKRDREKQTINSFNTSGLLGIQPNLDAISSKFFQIEHLTRKQARQIRRKKRENEI